MISDIRNTLTRWSKCTSAMNARWPLCASREDTPRRKHRLPGPPAENGYGKSVLTASNSKWRIFYLKEGEVHSSKSQFFLVTWAALFSPLAVLFSPLGCLLLWLCPHLGPNDRRPEREIKKQTNMFSHLSGITAILMREEGSALSELWLLWALFAISAITVIESVCGLGNERRGAEGRGEGNFEEVEDGKITTDWMVFQIMVFSSNLPAIIFVQSHKIPAPSILSRFYSCIQRDKHIHVCLFHCIQN